MIAMIVAIGWDFDMNTTRLACVIASSLCLVNIAHSASKITVKRENDKSVSIETRTVEPNVLDVMIVRLPSRFAAPRNACDTSTSSAFEIVSRDNVRCVGIVERTR